MNRRFFDILKGKCLPAGGYIDFSPAEIAENEALKAKVDQYIANGHIEVMPTGRLRITRKGARYLNS